MEGEFRGDGALKGGSRRLLSIVKGDPLIGAVGTRGSVTPAKKSYLPNPSPA